MGDAKIWIIPFISFSCFFSLLVLSLFYTYSDIGFSGDFQQSSSSSQVTNIQNFQEALGTKLK